MLRKLRIRFVLVNMSIVTVMLCVIFGMVYHFTRQNLEAQSLSILRSVVTAPSMPIRPGEIGEQVNLPFFSIKEEKGCWVADRGSFYDLSDEEYLQELGQEVSAQQKDTGILEAYGLRYLRVADPRGGQEFVFADITSEQNTLHKLVETCAAIGFLSFAMFLCISFLLAHWAVKPVDIAWQQQKQFVADASHELKTPLTVIQTSTELLRQTEDAAERDKFTNHILEMSHRMRQLVEELLLLARADNGQPLQNLAAVDFSRTVSDAILPFEPVFFEAGLSLSSQITENISVYGDGGKLRQLADILLDNARKYSLPGGETVLTLQRNGKNTVLEVSNPAASMTPQQCRDIFKRFNRIDSARTGGDSFGLGLSIAESIVQQHSGKISARYQNERFTIRAEIPTNG